MLGSSRTSIRWMSLWRIKTMGILAGDLDDRACGEHLNRREIDRRLLVRPSGARLRLRKISDCTEHNVAAVRLESASRHAASAAAVLDHDPPPRIHAERAVLISGRCDVFVVA
jgi:hypothetical protein